MNSSHVKNHCPILDNLVQSHSRKKIENWIEKVNSKRKGRKNKEGKSTVNKGRLRDPA